MEENSSAFPEQSDSPQTREETRSRAEELGEILKTGSRATNRAGALAFLAFLIIVAAGLHFFFSAKGGDAYLSRLDAQLRGDAELTLAAMENNTRLAISPSWPLQLYENLRRDILLYCAVAALSAYVWGLAARARARRDAFLVHTKLAAELAELREKLERLESRAVDQKAPDAATDTKG